MARLRARDIARGLRAALDQLPVADAGGHGDAAYRGRLALDPGKPDREADAATTPDAVAGVASPELRARRRRRPARAASAPARRWSRHQRGRRRRALRASPHPKRCGSAPPSGDPDRLLREGRDVSARTAAGLDTAG